MRARYWDCKVCSQRNKKAEKHQLSQRLPWQTKDAFN